MEEGVLDGLKKMIKRDDATDKKSDLSEQKKKEIKARGKSLEARTDDPNYELVKKNTKLNANLSMIEDQIPRKAKKSTKRVTFDELVPSASDYFEEKENEPISLMLSPLTVDTGLDLSLTDLIPHFSFEDNEILLDTVQKDPSPVLPSKVFSENNTVIRKKKNTSPEREYDRDGMVGNDFGGSGSDSDTNSNSDNVEENKTSPSQFKPMQAIPARRSSAYLNGSAPKSESKTLSTALGKSLVSKPVPKIPEQITKVPDQGSEVKSVRTIPEQIAKVPNQGPEVKSVRTIPVESRPIQKISDPSIAAKKAPESLPSSKPIQKIPDQAPESMPNTTNTAIGSTIKPLGMASFSESDDDCDSTVSNKSTNSNDDAMLNVPKDNYIALEKYDELLSKFSKLESSYKILEEENKKKDAKYEELMGKFIKVEALCGKMKQECKLMESKVLNSNLENASLTTRYENALFEAKKHMKGLVTEVKILQTHVKTYKRQIDVFDRELF